MAPVLVESDHEVTPVAALTKNLCHLLERRVWFAQTTVEIDLRDSWLRHPANQLEQSLPADSERRTHRKGPPEGFGVSDVAEKRRESPHRGPGEQHTHRALRDRQRAPEVWQPADGDPFEQGFRALRPRIGKSRVRAR